jgi:hypothetical protein
MPTIIEKGKVYVIQGDAVPAGTVSHGHKVEPVTEKPQYWDGKVWTTHEDRAKEFNSKEECESYLAKNRDSVK